MKTWNTARHMALSGASLAAMLFAGQALAQATDETSDNTLEAVVVTGSSIRGVPPVGSNLIGVSRDDIKTIGATTTPDLLASVPQLNSFNTAPRANNAGAGSFAPGSAQPAGDGDPAVAERPPGGVRAAPTRPIPTSRSCRIWRSSAWRSWRTAPRRSTARTPSPGSSTSSPASVTRALRCRRATARPTTTIRPASAAWRVATW